MVDVPDPLKHGQSPKKQDQRLSRRDETIESIKHVLASKGFDDKQSFAFIRLDEDGKVRVHASGQVKGFLDEQSMDSIFQEAYEKAVHDSFIMPEPTSAISIDDEEGSDYGDAEFPLVPQTFGTVQGSRVYRETRQRADRDQSMLPCNASRHFPVESYSEPEQVPAASPSEQDDRPVKPKKIQKSFRIDNTEEVCDFLATRLKRMQQLAVKKIAKAWIKGICPKKQAKFPYQNKKGEETTGFAPRVPGWWPDTSACRFIEPDHIRRDERMRLCLHLLRLRPTPTQLKEWNEDKSEPHPTHVLQGWTAFLAELAGVSIFEELQKEDKQRTDAKKDLLTKMYEVAGWEESYLNGGTDPSFLYSWHEEEEERRMIPAKRTLQHTVDYRVDRTSRESSESVDCKRVKRSRRNSTADKPCQLPEVDTSEGIPREGSQQPLSANALFDMNARQNETPAPPADENFTPVGRRHGQYDAAPMKRDSSDNGRWRHFESSQGRWVEGNVDPNSFQTPNSQFVMPSHYQPAPQVPVAFGSHQGYTYPQHPEQPHMVQVHQVNHIPEPQFQAVPNGPMYSPSGMMPVPLDNFVPQACSAPPPQPFPQSMAPNQYFLPANGDPSIGEFHAPMSQPFHDQHEIARHHTMPSHINGLPFTQPSRWEGRPFNGQCHNPT